MSSINQTSSTSLDVSAVVGGEGSPRGTIDYLITGYIANSFGAEDAIILFNKYVGNRGDATRPPGGIHQNQDGTYCAMTCPEVLLDYPIDQKGTVVRQSMWRTVQHGDQHRHFRDAQLQFPIFFVSTNDTLGVDLAHVANTRPGTPLSIYHANALAPLGGLATTHLCVKWPGYAQDFRKQVEIKNPSRLPITMSKLVERIAMFISRFIEEASNWPIDPHHAHWRVGRGYITRDQLYVIGLVHVSAGCWQPIIQLKGMSYYH